MLFPLFYFESNNSVKHAENYDAFEYQNIYRQTSISHCQKRALASVLFIFQFENGNPGKTVDDPRHLVPSVLRVLNPP
jgi:hypothetical protein